MNAAPGDEIGPLTVGPGTDALAPPTRTRPRMQVATTSAQSTRDAKRPLARWSSSEAETPSLSRHLPDSPGLPGSPGCLGPPAAHGPRDHCARLRFQSTGLASRTSRTP